MHTRSQLQDLSRFPIRGVKPTHRFPSILLIACLVFATLLSLFFSPGDAGAATPKASESQIASTAAASTPTPSVCATSTPTPSLYAASTDIIPTVAYNAHVQDIGWQAGTELAPTVEATWFKDGKTAGTTGQSKRVEAFQVVLPASSVSGSVIYNAHVANIGWQCDTDDENTSFEDGDIAGTTGHSHAIEAIQVALTGDVASAYDVYYRVHVQNIGWMEWQSNGTIAGTQGMSLRVEAVEIRLVAKTDTATEAELAGTPAVYAKAHAQDIGWSNPAACAEGATIGTTGKALRLEALIMTLDSAGIGGGLSYRAHVANIGWMDSVTDGRIAGTTGQSLAIEAVSLKLTGAVADKYDVYYRVHAANIGWMGWAKNGEEAGTCGFGDQAEAVQIVLVAKGGTAPADTGAATSYPLYIYSQRAGYTASAKNGATQLILVEASGTTATVSFHQKATDGTWDEAYETSGYVGSAGVGSTREGLSMTPEGSFELPFAFGTGENPGTHLDYHQITSESNWVEDVDYPDVYNTWQEDRGYTGNTEVLSEYPVAYEYAIVIGYNDPGYLGVRRAGCEVGAGSGFFLHCSSGHPTAGCVSIPTDAMLYAMQNVKSGCKIVISTRYGVFQY